LGLALDEPKENDGKIDLDGVELLAEETLTSFLDGQLIDFINSGYRCGFVISGSSAEFVDYTRFWQVAGPVNDFM
jgi:Fe-S cluster assembly iron-binding protein IscA